MKTTAPWGCLAIALLTASLSAVPAGATIFGLETKLTASDAAVKDSFGVSVAISGNTALVGAERGDGAGIGPIRRTDTGSAYLFDVTTGNELARLNASDEAFDDRFGVSVSISGNTALVGAARDDVVGFDSGSAYLFDVATGNQLFKLTASDAAQLDLFGGSVAISGNTALIGARGDDDAGRASGSAYLFDVTTGNQLLKLTASDAAEVAFFGNSVAISGNTALVGAERDDNDGGLDSGAAYLFDIATGNQLFKLIASDAAELDFFGSSVAISGNTALVGASGDEDGGPGSGSAYLFDITTGIQLFKLTASDAAERDFFGSSVSISGNTALIGASGDDDGGFGSGSAYLFDITTGEQIAKLTASDAAQGDEFGFSVTISGNTALVGARFEDNGGFFSRDTGAAYLFENEIPGDFDGDGDFDGSDFLAWQRGESPIPLSASDLALWQSQFGTTATLSAPASVAVPEPTALALICIAFAGLAAKRRR